MRISSVFKQVISLHKRLDNHATGLSIKLVRWTGKSREAIHPKHLISSPENYWYLAYLDLNDSVLDLGCGNGVHTLKAASYCRKIIGIDYSDDSLNLAARLAAQKMIRNATFQKADLEINPLPFADSSFDKVLFLDVIEHLQERERMLREIKRVLRAGGLLLLTAPNRETSWKRVQRRFGLSSYADPDHKIEYDQDEFIRELSQAGFRVKGTTMPIVYDTPFAGWIDLTGGFSLSLYDRLARWKREYVKKHPKETTGWRVVAEVLP
jgi:ubiquinone/menaquinone biosynthesis C-methylase UbiE